MRKYLLYPLIVIAVAGIFSSVFEGSPLNFRELFCNYCFEIVLLSITLVLITVLVCYEIFMHRSKKNLETILRLQNERNSYEERVEELTQVDDEVKRLRAIIQFKKDTGIADE